MMNNNQFGPTYYGYNNPSFIPPKPQTNQYSFVNGIEGAKSYMLMPGNTMLLMDADNPVCYMKSCDANGIPNLRYFKLEEMDEATARALTQPVAKPQVDYATKEDFNSLNKKLDELMKKFDRPVKKDKEVNNG